jgi:hypothetical protein
MAIKMKWSNTGASLIGPRDGALLRSPVSDSSAPVRSRRATHVHVHMPVPPARSHDAAPLRRDQATPGRAAVRRGDQEGPEPGQLVCRLAQDGRDGSWRAVDCDGRPLEVTTAGDGWLEIRHANGEEDPDQIQLQSPFGDANAGGVGENMPGKAFETAMAKAIAPSDHANELRAASRVLCSMTISKVSTFTIALIRRVMSPKHGPSTVPPTKSRGSAGWLVSPHGANRQ